MVLPFEFEDVKETTTATVTRAKVYGGWVVTIIVMPVRGSTMMTTTFVADSEWAWELKDAG